MITLYQPIGAWGLPSLSPFCVKLETYLRMAGLAFEVHPGDPRRAPKGKLPYVRIDGGELMGDSQLIIEHLERQHGHPLDGHLGPLERATGHAVRRMLEEGTYFHLVHVRWVNDDGWRVFQPAFRGILPAGLRPFSAPLLGLLRRKVAGMLRTQGTGRHAPDEISRMAQADLTALATLLGDRPFLLGDAPTTFDASAYAFVASLLAFPVDSELRRHALAQANLVGYRSRIEERFYGQAGPSAVARAA